MSDFNYDQLDPGVRDLVKRLHDRGVHTTDSGDGSKFGTMAGALPHPHIVAQSADIHCWFDDASAVEDVVPEGWEVELSGKWQGPFLIIASNPGPNEVDRINDDYDRANVAERELAEARTHIVAQDELIAKLQQKLDAAEKSAGDAFDIIDAFQTASGLWTDNTDPSGVRPKDVAKLIQDQDMRIGAATEILQMLLQSPLGSDDAHKALSMAGAWLVRGEIDG